VSSAYRAELVRGLCWRCEATDRLVAFLGPVQTVYGSGGFRACLECIDRLEALALADIERPRFLN
jgi:hypothetical protein